MELLDDEADYASTFIRGLIIKELTARGKLTTDDISILVGTAR